MSNFEFLLELYHAGTVKYSLKSVAYCSGHLNRHFLRIAFETIKENWRDFLKKKNFVFNNSSSVFRRLMIYTWFSNLIRIQNRIFWCLIMLIYSWFLSQNVLKWYTCVKNCCLGICARKLRKSTLVYGKGTYVKKSMKYMIKKFKVTIIISLINFKYKGWHVCMLKNLVYYSGIRYNKLK